LHVKSEKRFKPDKNNLTGLKRPMLKNSVRVSLVIISIILILGSSYFAYEALKPYNDSEKIILHSYSMSAEGSLEAELRENILYTDRIANEGQLLSNALVERLKFTFNASYTGSRGTVIEGYYSVGVLVQGYRGSSPREMVYEREYPILGEKTVSGVTNVRITEDVPLRLDEYLNFTYQAEQILNARLSKDAQLVFNGRFIAKNEFGVIEEPFTYTVLLPLSNELYTITMDEPISKTEYITETVETEVFPEYDAAMLPFTGLATGLLFTLSALFLTRQPNEKEKYAHLCKSIIRRYGSRMAQLAALPGIDGLTAIEAENIDSLVRVSDERRQPICYVLNGGGLPVGGLLFVPDGVNRYILRLKQPEALKQNCIPL
jgi:hypothetical protein